MTRFFLAVYTLALREARLFIRQKHRVISALMQPLIFWFVIGSGMNSSFMSSGHLGMPYTDYFFPGTILLVIMFTSIFATIGVIEDRKQGFLRGVIISPAPRSAIVAGKVIGGAVLATFQGFLFLLLMFTPLLHISLSFATAAAFLVIMSVVGIGLTGLGMTIAWRMDSVQGYHSIMSVLLFPMWIFSGAVFPIAGAPDWLRLAMMANPLTHGLEIMRFLLYQGTYSFSPAFTTLTVPICYVIGSMVAAYVVATWSIRRGN